MKILDLGTGSGYLSFPIAKKYPNISITGLDIVEKALEVNRFKVQAMIQWAFGNENVVFIEAETEPENRASQHIPEKCGFVPDGEGQEGPRFVLEKPLTNWMAIYMLFGISIGTSLGTSFDNVGIGLSLGICFGVSIGAVLDSSVKKERKKLLEQRSNKE